MYELQHFTRRFGAPCVDHRHTIGKVDHLPQTVAEVEAIVESFGLQPVSGSPSTYTDGFFFDVDVEFPQHSNIDSSWVQFVPCF